MATDAVCHLKCISIKFSLFLLVLLSNFLYPCLLADLQLEYLANNKSISPTFTTRYNMNGDALDQFQLWDRIDYLGYKKRYDTDNVDNIKLELQSDSVDTDTTDTLLPVSTNPITFADTPVYHEWLISDIELNSTDSDENEAITVVENVRIAFNSTCIRNGTFCLREQIFHGGHGDIYRGHRLQKDGLVDRAVPLVLKRMQVNGRPDILRCAEREIYFGSLLKGQPNFPRYVTHFFGPERTDLWIVYRDEGISLQQLFYAMTVDETSVLLRPSSIWRKFRATDAGKQSMRVLMLQLINHVSRLHALGIIHRDIKPSNILLNTEESEPHLVVNDFSSALNEEAVRLGLFGESGPSKAELTLDYAPPETRLSDDEHVSFDLERPESYDIWSLGVVFLEFLLGSGRVLETLDQRTEALIRHRLKSRRRERGYEQLLQNTLYLASLADFGIFKNHTQLDDRELEGITIAGVGSEIEKSGEVVNVFLRNEECSARLNNSASNLAVVIEGVCSVEETCSNIKTVASDLPLLIDPIAAATCKAKATSGSAGLESSAVKRNSKSHWHNIRETLNPTVHATISTCVDDMREAILRRDPLGLGISDRWGLDLICRLLAFNPHDRIELSVARQHAYFHGPYRSTLDGSEHSTPQDLAAYEHELSSVEDLSTNEAYPNLKIRKSAITVSTIPSATESKAFSDIPTIHVASAKAIPSVRDIDYISMWLELTTPDEAESASALLNAENGCGASDDKSAPLVSELSEIVYRCPGCGRVFQSYTACATHQQLRRHGSRCISELGSSNTAPPPCLSDHSLLPMDSLSGWCDLQGRRQYIEDNHAVVINDAYRFYGVYDGHFGSRAARFTSHHLHLRFQSLLFQNSIRKLDINETEITCFLNSLNDGKNDWRDLVEVANDFDIVATLAYDDTELSNLSRHGTLTSKITSNSTEAITVGMAAQAIRQAYIDTEAALLRRVGPQEQSGTTAVTVAVFKEHLLIANSGDSRAVLCCDDEGKPIQLTRDHTADEPSERARVLNLGGAVSRPKTGGRARVNGTLAVTRAIGDFSLKPWITVEPDVLVLKRIKRVFISSTGEQSETSLGAIRDCKKYALILKQRRHQLEFKIEPDAGLFLLVGSDGLWDYVSNKDACDIVCSHLLDLLEQSKVYATNLFNEDEIDSTSQLRLFPNDSFHNAARILVQEAWLRGSDDNIGVCVANLIN